MRPESQLDHARKVRITTLPSGRPVPVLGQGTWRMGEDRTRRASEVAALRMAVAMLDTGSSQR